MIQSIEEATARYDWCRKVSEETVSLLLHRDEDQNLPSLVPGSTDTFVVVINMRAARYVHRKSVDHTDGKRPTFTFAVGSSLSSILSSPSMSWPFGYAPWHSWNHSARSFTLCQNDV